ncbi:MAG: CoA-binding protein [Tenuifilaceae bacterium]
MNKKEKIESFLQAKHFAITGVSRDEKKFGRMVYQSFIDKGISAYPVNPSFDNINGATVYPSVKELPSEVDAIVILNNRNKSQEIIDQAIGKGIKNIWIQQESDPVGFSKLTFDSSFNIITKECIFMWLEPVTGFHKFHRFLKMLFSKN